MTILPSLFTTRIPSAVDSIVAFSNERVFLISSSAFLRSIFSLDILSIMSFVTFFRDSNNSIGELPDTLAFRSPFVDLVHHIK